MAAALTWERLRELAAFRAENGCAVSLYLNLDPRLTPTAGDAQSRMNALLNEGEKEGDGLRSQLTHGQRRGLQQDFTRIGRWFDDEFDRDRSQGLAVFAAALDNFWSPAPLPRPVPDTVRVARDFYLAPLIPLLGRLDGTIVAVVGREQGQLYRLRSGRLEPIADHTEEQPGQHDQGGWSQANYQRHIDKLVHDHLKEVAGALDQRARRVGAPRIVLVCSEDMRSEVLERLSHAAREAVAGWTPARAHATPAELLEVVSPVLERAEVKEETETIERWREEAGRNGRAASGWASTLEAASDGRVEILLFREGVDREAWRCPACGRAALDDGSCPLDGTTMERYDHGVDLAVHQTLAHGGAVQAVRHHDDLGPVEGIGAILRY
jgi:peptide chain release factor subunit 1